MSLVFRLHYSSDGDLQEAIRLSLCEHDGATEKNDVINLVEDTEPTSLWVAPQLTYHLNFLKGHSTQENEGSIKLSNIIMPSALSAILTTYQLDLDWLLHKFPILKEIPVMIVHSHKNLTFECNIPSQLHLKQPPLPIAYGCCHGKIMLIKYSNFLRVAVSTANLLSFDYDRKTQGIWVQDFPKMDTKQDPKSEIAIDFISTLEDYLTLLGLKAAFLRDYSFENVKVVLVTSVPGYHQKEKLMKYGHMKVRKYLSSHPIPTEFEAVPVVGQVSSIGALSKTWMNEFGVSFAGSFENTTTTTKKDAHEKKTKKAKNNITQTEIKIVWPTVDFVKECIDGYSAGGSLCFPKHNLKEFLTENIFCIYEPSFIRSRIPPHIKTYTRSVRVESKKKEIVHKLPWVILTSSNLSKAAWGSLQKKNTQFMIRHYEVGVMFLPWLCDDQQQNVVFQVGAPVQLQKDDCLQVSFPLPYSVPIKPYSKKDRQWVWDVSYEDPDIFGNTWPM